MVPVAVAFARCTRAGLGLDSVRASVSVSSLASWSPVTGTEAVVLPV